MNFHKTIGFLAALLLTLGLGVSDSYAQELQSVTLSLNGTAGSDDDPPTAAVTVADNVGTTVVTVSVTATYDAGLEAGETKTVMVDVKAMGTTAEATDYASQPAFPLTITATAVAGALTTATGSATIILTPVADMDIDDELVVLEATIGDQMDEAILSITDSEVGVTSVTLSLNGTAGSNDDPPAAVVTVADNAGATAVTVGVSVNFEDALADGETRTVMVGVKGMGTTTESGDYSTIPSLPVSITLTGDGNAATLTGSTSIALTPATDTDDAEDEAIVLEATIANSDQTDEAIVAITDSDNSITGVTLSLNGTEGSDDDPPTAAVTVADDAGATAVTVRVSVNFEDALADGETRTVMVSVGDDSDAEPGDYTTAPTLPVSITVTGDGAANPIRGTTSIVLTPADDPDTDAENIVLEATVEGQTDEAIVQITDTDIDYSVTSVTLSLNGQEGDSTPHAAATFGDNIGATIVTVSVSVEFANALADGETRTVMVGVKSMGTTAEDVDYSTDPSLPVSITLTGDGNAATLTESTNIVLTPAADADGDDEAIVLEATVAGSNQADEATLTITDEVEAEAGAVQSVVLSPSTLSVMEGETLAATVTVTVNVAAGAATVHDVVLTADGAMLTDLGLDASVSVPIMQNATSGTAEVTVTYMAEEDDDNTADEEIAITGTTGGMSGTSTLTVSDNDMSTVTSVALSPAMLSVMEGDAITATVTVTVNVDLPGAASSHSVDLTAAGAMLTDLGLTTPVMVDIDAGTATSGTAEVTVTYTAMEDDNTADETFTITGMVGTVSSDPVTLTVADNDAGTVTSVALSPTEISLTEGVEFTGMITVTVNVEAGDATTRVVALSSTLPTGSIATPVMVDIAKDATSGMAEVALTYTPPQDDNTTDETMTITGSVGDVSSDPVTLTIADDDMGAVASVEFSPGLLFVNEGATLATTVTVTVNVATGGAAASHSLDLIADAANTGVLAALGLPASVMVDVAKDATSGMAEVAVNYTAPEDDNTADETIAIISSIGGRLFGLLILNVADNDPGAVTGLTISPDAFDLTEGVPFSETVTVTVDVAAGAATTHSVTLSSSLPTGSITPTPVMVDVGQGETSGMAEVALSYTPPEDTDSFDGTMTITGTLGTHSDVVTLTIADNDKQAIKISTDLESIRENSRTRSVVVTATLPAAPGAGNTVTVNVMVTGGTAPVPATITIAGTDLSGTATVAITPVNDEVFTTSSFTVTGSATGYVDGTAAIDILDDDASLGMFTITSAPPSATLNGGDQDLTLTVKVTLAAPDTQIPSSLVVNVATDKGTLASPTVTITNTTKNVDKDPAITNAEGTATVVLSLAAADVNAAGNITVTASAAMYETGTREIPIRARGALDVDGYRAVIAKPTGTTWANVGNDKIFVDVTRFGDVAYPWTAFESIKVSVRDTAHASHEIEQVTASGFNREDNGDVTFLEPASGSRGDVIWRGNDTIRFEIRIRAYAASRDPADDGEYLGAYAHVEFKSGSDTEVIETRDDETSVYSANPSLVNDAKVGDGRLIKIDNQVPTHSGVADIVVTSGDAVGSAIDATVGDEIRVAVAVSQTNLFRETGMRIQLQVVDGTGTVNGQLLTAAQRNNPSKNKDFTAAQVINAANDSLIHTYTVTEGYFQVTLTDFVEGVGPLNAKIDMNNARGRVRAGKKDQAGNFKWFGWTTFDIDSRSPSVSILYPSADPDSIYEHTHPLRFSGAVESIVEGQNVDAHLNPLAIVVDEDLSKLEVFAVGADTLDITGQLPSDVINDSLAVYDTSSLSSPAKDEDDEYEGTAFIPSSANRAGTEIELAVIATDMLGNTTKTTISGVTHDAAPPVITEWFPKNSLLPEDQINDATPPIFTLPEDVDSIAVTFEGSNGVDVTEQRGAAAKGEHSIDFSGKLVDEVLYDMTIFARDLAGNVFITPADSSASMRFNAQFDNPVANRFTISTETDSVIAGQANILTVQAEDHDANSNTTRNALTYKNAARISAWDASGGAAGSVWFEGTGVTDDADNPDGVAMLSAADWNIGKRSVTVKSNKATGFIKILVQHVTSGQGGTAVLGFEGAKDSLYVGAADFAAFDITAWEEGVEGAAEEIWGDYTLRVVPVDRHGNPSVRAFKADPASAEDSLAVLDTRVTDNAFEYKDGIDVEIVGVPTIEDFALLILSIGKEGATYDLVAPDDRRSQTVQVRVVNTSLKEGDTRSQNVRSSARSVISEPLTPVLTLWVPGSDVDEAGNDVVIPADPGDITVTVAAAGFNAGDMVTFTRNGTAGDPVAADSDGVARLMITASMASTTTVSATNGLYSTDELTITFTDGPVAPARKSYVDANGDPVYLISDADMTVGVDDFLALVAAFMSSDGDDNYNAQADVNDDGTVNVADFLEFLTSWGRTAAGPATKPLVMLPGINENAEFSLSLGSERVVAGELVAVDVSLANVAALVGYGFALNYESDNFEFVSVAPADEDLLKSTGGETLFHHIVADGQVTVANGLFNGTAISGGGDAVRFVFRVLREFEDNARFEIANGLVFDPSQLQNPAVVAGVLELQSTPREFALHQNFPNPFNPDTTIKYDLAESADVTLQIYNVLGQVIRTLVASEAQNAGRYQIRWNGMDDRGVSVSSGIYFYQISADGKFSDVRKLMLLK